MPPVIVRDDDDQRPPPPPIAGNRIAGLGFAAIVLLLVLLIAGARSIANFFVEREWWKELGQVDTWYAMLSYSIVPFVASAILVFAVLWIAHARGMSSGGARMRDYRRYARVSTILILFFSIFLSLVLIDSWTVVRFFGARGDSAPGLWNEPVFGKPLPFYLFELPFYRMLLRLLIGLSLATIFVYWLAARGWGLRERFRDLRENAHIDISDFGLREMLESKLIRIVAALGLVVFALQMYLGRYDRLTQDHNFMVGVDYVVENVTLPLLWLSIAACVAAAALVLSGRLKIPIMLLVGAQIVPGLVSQAVNWARVRPNEITIQKPYIERHIAGTRAAYGLDRRTREIEFSAKMDGRFDSAAHRAALDNVRLWDWRAFHDTIAQIQALRPYYVFADSDVDRYKIAEGSGSAQMRQVLLTPRELDVRQLPDASSWINRHFIYTHGYGVVMAEANRITADGLPYLFIQNAPPEIRTKLLKLTRPEIYYGEVVHEPVFVRTAQPEFDYPSGSENKHTRYEGKGGFPISSLPMRLAAAVRQGDWNILLTDNLTPESRMMIRRKVVDRLEHVAEFLAWDEDPYLVVTNAGRLMWIVDGYTTSDAHPYSRALRTSQFGTLNYLRNAVKATVDAYDGTVTLYIFDDGDPIIRAYQRLFPKLFQPASAMPADLREHTRYPETIFRVQAEIYRIFHMRDPEAFYNKEDVWDIARHAAGQESASAATPTYVMASLPDSDQSEFLLMIPFTPRNKDNLIGLMVARCDGERMGEIQFLQLSKQELIFGPMQIKARINQDQTIAKDLALWNQQGSKVIRGQMLVLPVGNTFLYVEPIYLQAAQAPMPQLKKIALASGSQIAYADTYPQALSLLQEALSATLQAAAEPTPSRVAEGSSKVVVSPANDRRLDDARTRMRRYSELLGQGKFAEAGKELEALQELLK